jgi:hypothetical protein
VTSVVEVFAFAFAFFVFGLTRRDWFCFSSVTSVVRSFKPLIFLKWFYDFPVSVFPL